MKIRALVAGGATALALAATSAVAGQCGYQYCWGAVGFGPGNAWGYAHSYASQQAAYNRVHQECGGNCTQIKTFYNTCGAIAAGANNGWGWGHAPSRQQAQNIALGYCNQYDNGCTIRAWACSF